MRPKRHRTDRDRGICSRARLDQIINMKHDWCGSAQARLTGSSSTGRSRRCTAIRAARDRDAGCDRAFVAQAHIMAYPTKACANAGS